MAKKRINVRAKGYGFERFIAAAMRMVGYTKAHRQLEFQINNALGIDIAETGRYKIQCKKTKKYVPMNTINEVKFKGDEMPVLIAAGDGEPPLVTMRLEDWLYIVSFNLDDLNTSVMTKAEVIKGLSDIKNNRHKELPHGA
jgi:hypothetical protein